MVAFQPLTWDWTPVVIALAAISVVLGSVLAIAQTDIKRMLAYSSIAQAGFILMGLTNATTTGIRAALFYLVAYATMTLGAFGIVMLVCARGEEQTSLSSYAGLYKRSPFLAVLMTIFLLSLAGIPPTAGFIAKVSVFSAAIQAGHWELALLGVAGERRGGVLLPPRDRADVHAGPPGRAGRGRRGPRRGWRSRSPRSSRSSSASSPA